LILPQPQQQGKRRVVGNTKGRGGDEAPIGQPQKQKNNHLWGTMPFDTSKILMMKQSINSMTMMH